VSSDVLPLRECAWSWYLSEIRNMPPSRASKTCTWPLILCGASHATIETGSRKARLAAPRGALIIFETRVLDLLADDPVMFGCLFVNAGSYPGARPSALFITSQTESLPPFHRFRLFDKIVCPV